MDGDLSIRNIVSTTISDLENTMKLLATDLENLQLVEAFLRGQNDNYISKFSLAFSKTHVNKAAQNSTKELNKMPPKYQDGTFRQKGKKLEYRFMLDGEQLSVTGINETECFDIRTKIIAGELPKHRNKSKVKKQETFNDSLIEWFELYKVPNIDPDTARGMKSYINNDILPYFKGTTLKKVSPTAIQKFLLQFNDKPNKKYKIALIISGFLKKAVALRKITYNPFLAVEVRRPDSDSFKAFTYSQQNDILIKLDNTLLREIYFILCCTGLRIGEFLALSPQLDINYIDHYFSIHKTKSGYTQKIKNRTKTRRDRYVPFTDELTPHLVNCFKLIEQLQPTYDSIQKQFRVFLDNNKFDDNYAIHSCRHTFGSVAYNVGIPAKNIQIWLGHSKLDMTLNIYTEILPSGDSAIKQYIIGLGKQLNLIP